MTTKFKIIPIIFLLSCLLIMTSCGKKYSVTFKDYDGTILKIEKVKEGKSATPPQEPVRDGYIFIRWSDEYNNIQKDLVITALYEENQIQKNYIVNFNTNSEIVIESQYVQEGSKIEEPLSPTRLGYTFCGWYLNNEKWVFETKTVNQNITLSAKWEKIIYNITYELNDGIVQNPSTYTIEDKIILNNPIREGYTFIGWTTKENQTPKLSVILSNEAGDKHFIANWEQQKLKYKLKINGEYEIVGLINKSETEVIIPKYYAGKKITSIGDYAFSYCNSLKSVEISDSIISIGCWAFRGCTGLTNIEIPSSVISIGEYAFLNCSQLTNMEISENIINIGDYAFADCEKLKFNVYNNANYLGNKENPYLVLNNIIDYSAPNCEINEKTKIILNNAFDSYEILANISIPSNVISLGCRSFYNCVNLKNVEIPDSVTKIGMQAFASCSSLEKIIISNRVQNIEEQTFYNCARLIDVSIGDNVSDIGKEAFAHCTTLKTIKIPDSVKYIGYKAFYQCLILENVILGTSIVNVGSEVFENCPNLKYNIYDNAKYLGNEQNPYLVLIKSVNSYIVDCKINDETKVISNYAFEKNNKLTNIKIPSSVISIGEGAFYYCENLINIEIPNSVTSIGGSAFSHCKKLTKVVLPNGIMSVEKYIFSSCSSLTSVKIPNSVTSIGDSAFSGCSSLVNIEIPSSVTSIGGSAFSGCSSLEYNIYDNALYLGNIDNAYFVLIDVIDSSINTCQINKQTKIISNSAFSFCSSLISIEIPDSVTSIGDSAFSGCSNLEKIIIPDSVKKIGSQVFFYCNNNLIIYCETITEIEGWDRLWNISNCPVIWGCDINN